MLVDPYSKFLLLLVVLELHSSGAADGGVLTNKAFQNFDLKCLPSETVSGLVYKKFVSANGTADLELSLFCRSIASPDDTLPEVTESHCRNGQKFPLQNNSTTTVHGSDCKAGEYISGLIGTFENHRRMLRLRCCKASNSHPDDNLGCRTIGPQSLAAVAVTGLRDPMQLKSGCPRNVLSSFSVSRGKLAVKFCALAMDGARYESYCYADQRHDTLSKDNVAGSLNHFASASFEREFTAYQSVRPQRFDRLETVNPDEETKYGQSFQIVCKLANEGFDHFDVLLVNGPDGKDLVFKFSCKAVTAESQTAVKKRVTRFVTLNATDTTTCTDNETLCGFYGDFNRSRLHNKRRYAFACCEGSNWYSVPDSVDELDTVISDDGRKKIIGASGAGASVPKLLQAVSLKIGDHAVITTVFLSYRNDPEARFLQNKTTYEYKSST